MINKVISDFSCNKEEFEEVQSVYETLLKDSGHFSSMSVNNSNTQNARRNRNRKVIWLNLSYSQFVKTNIEKLFISLQGNTFPKQQIPKDFQPKHFQAKLLLTIHVRNIIKQHNSKMLIKENDSNNRTCNCRSKPNCHHLMSSIQTYIYNMKYQLCLPWNFWMTVWNTA